MEEAASAPNKNNKTTIYVAAAVIVILIVLGIVYLLSGKSGSYNSSSSENSQKEASQSGSTSNLSLAPEKKAAHFESSTPMHGDTYATAPINVTINFNFDLVPTSTITVTKDGQDWSEGEIKIVSNKLTMQKSLKAGLADGVYLVEYKACWPDGSCHDGAFAFVIDSAGKVDYQDMTDKSEVTVDMKNFVFVQKKIRISKGTKVTWVNMDDAAHYVNTDSHPGHTYFPVQNSASIAKGQYYSTTFVTAGQYNYHCSAHYPEMVASLIVE